MRYYYIVHTCSILCAVDAPYMFLGFCLRHMQLSLIIYLLYYKYLYLICSVYYESFCILNKSEKQENQKV